ncbi:Uncharacterised protein g7210 [Pycnogonum litorale]
MMQSISYCMTSTILISLLSTVVIYGQFNDQILQSRGQDIYDSERDRYSPVEVGDPELELPLKYQEDRQALSDSYLMLKAMERNWNEMWRGREPHDIVLRKDKKQNWNNLRGMWGKRSEPSIKVKPSWIQLRGMWGKRSSPISKTSHRTIVIENPEIDPERISGQRRGAMLWQLYRHQMNN